MFIKKVIIIYVWLLVDVFIGWVELDLIGWVVLFAEELDGIGFIKAFSFCFLLFVFIMWWVYVFLVFDIFGEKLFIKRYYKYIKIFIFILYLFIL